MKDSIFQDVGEINRLAVQNRLFSSAEKPIYRQIMNGSGLTVLDIGCNNGGKTVDRFKCDNVNKVIGIEYHQKLVDSAQKKYGGDKFVFYCLNAESAGFISQLNEILAENNIESVDIIHISLVLMHLNNPQSLLTKLRDILSPDGKIIIVEAEDSASRLIPDEGNLFRDFMQLLKSDPWAGDRTCADKLPDMLKNAGYCNISKHTAAINAGGTELQKKKDIIDVFFSYLPLDIKQLCRIYPDNAEYKRCMKWLDSNYSTLTQEILKEKTDISMGICVYTGYGR